MTEPSFKIGDKVQFIDKSSDYYPRLRNAYGIIRSKGIALSFFYVADWYKNNDYSEKIRSVTDVGFYGKRLSLETRETSSVKNKTPVERKCQYLWNASHYIQKYPEQAY